jgi:hypothetical protein
MDSVSAPAGFEGAVFFDDAIREYRVSFRRCGDTWWTLCGTAGHCHLTKEERYARAEAAIRRAIADVSKQGD